LTGGVGQRRPRRATIHTNPLHDFLRGGKIAKRGYHLDTLRRPRLPLGSLVRVPRTQRIQDTMVDWCGKINAAPNIPLQPICIPSRYNSSNPQKISGAFSIKRMHFNWSTFGLEYYRPQTPKAFPARAGRINTFQSSRRSSPECRKIKRHPPGRIHDQGEPIEQLHGILRLEEKLEPTRTYQTARTVGRPKPDDQRTIHSALGQAQN